MNKTERRKDEIVEVSAKLFKEKGYSAITMRDIAKALDIKAASLYNHIKSKQDLLKIIIISIAEEFTNRMQTISSSEKTSIEKLEEIISLHVNIAYNNPHRMGVLNNDWMHLEEELDYYLELRNSYENNFRDIVISGIETEEIVNTNSETAVFSILTTLRSLYLWIPKKEDLNPEELTRNLTQVLINGIANY